MNFAPADLQPTPDHPLTKEEADQELALQHQLLPPCKQQRYPLGAIRLPRNHDYTSNLKHPDPLSNSILQYDQQKEHFTLKHELTRLLLSLLILFLLALY